MILKTLGVLSMGIVMIFTLHAAMQAATHGQSPRSSIIEAWVNIVIGFSINMLMNIVMFPMMAGSAVTLEANWWGGWCYTAASIFRQYAIRRWFNDYIHRAAVRLAGEKQ